MTRIEELSLKFMDGLLTEDEEQELDRLVTSDEGAARDYADLIELDGDLCGTFTRVDVSGDVMSSVEQAEEADMRASVMADVRREARRAKPREARDVWLRFAPLAAGIAAAVVAAWWVSGKWQVASGEWQPARNAAGSVAGGVAEVAEATDTGCWMLDAGKKSALKVGDEVRAGDRIEVGEKGRVVLAYTVGAKVDLGPGSILSMPEARPMSPTGPTRPTSKLEKGALTAHVEKRSAIRRRFAILTPHARAEVVGTIFSLAVEGNSTRIEVLKGLVGFARLADGESVDVAAGRYAVAAEGVTLAALALPVRPAPKAMGAAPRPILMAEKYGETIFEDDMKDLDNWDIVIGSPEKGYEAVTSNPERYWEMDYPRFGVKRKKVFVVNPRPAETRNRYVGIRSKKPIDAERFVVEALMSFQAMGGNTAVVTEGIEALEKDGVLIARWRTEALSRNAAWFRWEFAPAKRAPSEGMLVRRFFYLLNKASDASYVRPTSKRILLAVSNVGGCIHRVRVRRLPEDFDVE